MATTISGTTITFNDGTTQTTTGIEFASGTVMMFRQTAAPTGWTKDTTNYNDHALRVVTGTIGSGGSVNFSTAMASQAVGGSVSVSGGGVSATTLSTAQLPSHGHNLSGPAWVQFGSGVGRWPDGSGWGSSDLGLSQPAATGSGSSHTHSFTAPTASFSGNAINMAVKYCDVIFATKN